MSHNIQPLYLSDESIGMIAKLVQMAILTGTDVTDNLRTLRLQLADNHLVPEESFLNQFEENIEKMLEVTAHGQFN